MKKFILAVLVLIPSLTFSQIIDELPTDENGNLYFSEVVPVENGVENILYTRSKQFFVDTYKSANDVIQMEDKESGIIIGKAFTDIYISLMGTATPVQMWYTIKIQSKEGRYKYEIYDIYYKSYPSQSSGSVTIMPSSIFDKGWYYKKNGKTRKAPEQYKLETIKQGGSLDIAIKAAMNKDTTAPDTGNDW